VSKLIQTLKAAHVTCEPDDDCLSLYISTLNVGLHLAFDRCRCHLLYLAYCVLYWVAVV